MKLDSPILLDNAGAWRTYLGGSLLARLHGRDGAADDHFPEEWIMSVVAARNAGREHIQDEGMSRIAATGETLRQFIERAPVECLGEACVKARGTQMGVLLKLIDSSERLSIQVHPDRQKAMELFGSPYGKTECWHILGGRTIDGEAPCIYFGFKPGITRERWKALFDAQDIPGMLGCMHRIEVKPGDTFLISGGIPHAIGAGCFLVEIQEPTDYTIRTERSTPSGLQIDDRMCHQGLGFERMFECFHYDGQTEQATRERWSIPSRLLAATDGGSVSQLIGPPETDYFQLNELRVSGSLRIEGTGAFSGLYILEGEGDLAAGGRHSRVAQAQQYFVPAACASFTLTADPGRPIRAMQAFGPQSAGR